MNISCKLRRLLTSREHLNFYLCKLPNYGNKPAKHPVSQQQSLHDPACEVRESEEIHVAPHFFERQIPTIDCILFFFECFVSESFWVEPCQNLKRFNNAVQNLLENNLFEIIITLEKSELEDYDVDYWETKNNTPENWMRSDKRAVREGESAYHEEKSACAKESIVEVLFRRIICLSAKNNQFFVEYCWNEVKITQKQLCRSKKRWQELKRSDCAVYRTDP